MGCCWHRDMASLAVKPSQLLIYPPDVSFSPAARLHLTRASSPDSFHLKTHARGPCRLLAAGGLASPLSTCTRAGSEPGAPGLPAAGPCTWGRWRGVGVACLLLLCRHPCWAGHGSEPMTGWMMLRTRFPLLPPPPPTCYERVGAGVPAPPCWPTAVRPAPHSPPRRGPASSPRCGGVARMHRAGAGSPARATGPRRRTGKGAMGPGAGTGPPGLLAHGGSPAVESGQARRPSRLVPAGLDSPRAGHLRHGAGLPMEWNRIMARAGHVLTDLAGQQIAGRLAFCLAAAAARGSRPSPPSGLLPPRY